MKHKYKMPNSGKGGDAGSGKSGSNKGATGGLRTENKMRSDTLKKPDTTNRYPNGMA